MERISVKEYARSRGVSSEIVRRQLVRYEKELEGHLSPLGKSKLLDEEAVKFLDGHRMQKTVTIELTDPETQKVIDELREELRKAQQEITKLQAEQIELQRQQISLIEEKSRYQGMIEEKERSQKDQEKRIEEQNRELRENRQQMDVLWKEVNSFQRSVFGFWRKKKT